MVPNYDDYRVKTVEGTNTLGLVIFACVFGIIVGQMGENGQPVVKLMVSLQKAITRLVHLILWLVPLHFTEVGWGPKTSHRSQPSISGLLQLESASFWPVAWQAWKIPRKTSQRLVTTC